MEKQLANNVPPQFTVQLAHSDARKIIKDFYNVKELYKKISEAFQIPANTVRIVKKVPQTLYEAYVDAS